MLHNNFAQNFCMYEDDMQNVSSLHFHRAGPVHNIHQDHIDAFCEAQQLPEIMNGSEPIDANSIFAVDQHEATLGSRSQAYVANKNKGDTFAEVTR